MIIKSLLLKTICESMRISLKDNMHEDEIKNKILLLYADKAMYNNKVLKNRYGSIS